MGNRNRRDEAVRGARRDGFLSQFAGEIPGQGPSILRKRQPMHGSKPLKKTGWILSASNSHHEFQNRPLRQGHAAGANQETKAMKKEYDFSKAERGRMHTPFTASSVRLHLYGLKVTRRIMKCNGCENRRTPHAVTWKAKISRGGVPARESGEPAKRGL